MDVDHILSVFNQQEVRYLLIGGVNYLLRHQPVLTFDVDFWIEDSDGNRRRCEHALSLLEAQWGPSEEEWKPVAEMAPDWLARQPVYCLTSTYGAIDIFRSVRGLADWGSSFADSVAGVTAAGVAYRGLSDRDMLKCQLVLDPESRKNDRIRELERVIHAS